MGKGDSRLPSGGGFIPLTPNKRPGSISATPTHNTTYQSSEARQASHPPSPVSPLPESAAAGREQMPNAAVTGAQAESQQISRKFTVALEVKGFVFCVRSMVLRAILVSFCLMLGEDCRDQACVQFRGLLADCATLPRIFRHYHIYKSLFHEGHPRGIVLLLSVFSRGSSMLSFEDTLLFQSTKRSRSWQRLKEIFCADTADCSDRTKLFCSQYCFRPALDSPAIEQNHIHAVINLSSLQI